MTRQSHPQFILLPGFHGTAALFDAFQAEITLPCLPVAYPASPVMDYAELVAFVEASVPANQPFYLLAESFSGPIAITVASRCPDTCLGLILCASFARDPVGIAGRWLPEFLHPLFVSVARSNRLASVRDWFLLGEFRTAEVSQRLSAAVARLTQEAFSKRMREALRADATEALRQCRCPVLILQATQDRLLSKACIEHLRHSKPEAAVVRIEASHLLLQTNPVAAAKAITTWLDSRSTQHSSNNLF